MTEVVRRQGWVAGGLALGLLAAWPGVEAGTTDADGTYTVTITQIEISKDAGANYATLFSGSQAVNIASENAGATVAGMASGVELDAGSYDRARVTLDATLLAKGYVNSGGSTFYTDGGTETGAGESTSQIAGLNNTTAADYAVSTYTIPVADRTQVVTFTSPVTVNKDNPRTVIVTFNTAGVLSLNVVVVVPGAPSVSVSSR
jgi:hypothetical protein